MPLLVRVELSCPSDEASCEERLRTDITERTFRNLPGHLVNFVTVAAAISTWLTSGSARRGDRSYRPHPRLARALDIMFILHAEHEMNCSTAAVRHLSSRYAHTP